MADKTKSFKLKLIIFLIILILLVSIPFLINFYVIKTTEDNIFTLGDVDLVPETVQCVMVLGAGLKPDGRPNLMLEDRLDVGIALYKAGFAPKILLTGDNGQDRYDEVNAMKEYVMAEGIPAEDIFMDHAGFSTYESIYRSKAIFDVTEMIVITQRYHQYRALYISKSLGIKAYGVVPEYVEYSGEAYREFREILARNKDFFKCIIKPEPKFLGDVIPISGNGLTSHD